MRKRIALVAVVAAAAVAYTAYKKAKMQKVAQHDKDNPLIVKPLNGDAAVVEAGNLNPQAEEPSETETLEDVPVETVETESHETESVPPEPIIETLPNFESEIHDPFGLDSFIQERTQVGPEEIIPQPKSEETIVLPDPEQEPEVENITQNEPTEAAIIEANAETVDTEASKPEIHETNTLTNTLLESYRIQCKVMMDGYPSNKKIDLIHHIEFKDSKNRNKFVDSLQIEYHEIEDSPEGLSATIRQTIPTDARVAYSEIVKLAEASEVYHGLYQGWVLVDCR